MNRILDRVLVAYSYLPHLQAKDGVVDWFVKKAEPGVPQFRTRFGVTFQCDLTEKVEREIFCQGFAT